VATGIPVGPRPCSGTMNFRIRVGLCANGQASFGRTRALPPASATIFKKLLRVDIRGLPPVEKLVFRKILGVGPRGQSGAHLSGGNTTTKQRHLPEKMEAP
jgi:hypothetical protein